MPSIFDKEPGTGLPAQVERIGRSALNITLPQVGLLREHFFDGSSGKWPEHAFAGFLTFPIVAGYILGVTGEYMTNKGLSLSQTDTLRSVIDIGNHFEANDHHVEMSTHYMMQQGAFKFGLDIGAADVRRYLAEQLASGSSEYALLAMVGWQFLSSGDDRTLKANLGVFCRMHRIPTLSDDVLDRLVERWNIQKQYSMGER